MAQKFKFPMEYLRVTQGENSAYSHAGSLAMDFGGKDTGADKLYCPCDMVVKRCRYNANGELYLESTLPVEFADGSIDYARLICLHDNAFNVVEGQVLKQGDYFYDEGGMGAGKANAFGTHVHMEAGKGKWKSCTQSANAQGTYVIENQSHLYDLFILGDDVQIINDGGYPWKRVSDIDTYTYGVDLSHNRSKDIMQKIVANGKADFAILRVGIGSESVDNNLIQYVADRGEMKLGFFSANYFYSIEDAKAEADFLIDTIESMGFNPGNVALPIFCDWEYFSDEWNKKHGRNITPEQLQEMTVAYCNRIKERGYRAGVYLNYDYWVNWYGKRFFNQHPEYYIWYARPGYAQPYRDCYLWQYACDNGGEYGADEPLDKNILLGEYIETKPGCQECERLKVEIALVKEGYEYEIAGLCDIIRGANSDKDYAYEQLAEAEQKLTIAAEQMRSSDYFIQQLKTENGVLKETIISLQEKAEEKRPPKENLLIRIFDRFMKWLKGV